MNETPKKRPWLQLHLSTAIVLMFVAGGIIGANVNGLRGKFIVEGFDGQNAEVTQVRGWPFHPEFMTEEETKQYNGFGDWLIPPFVYFSLDFAVAIIVLFVVWLVCELWISRRTSLEGIDLQ